MGSREISVSFYGGIDDKVLAVQQALPYEAVLLEGMQHIKKKVCIESDENGSLSGHAPAFGLLDVERNTHFKPNHVFCGSSKCKLVVICRPFIMKFKDNNIVWEYFLLQCMSEFMQGELGTVEYTKRLKQKPIAKSLLMKLCLCAFLMPRELPFDGSHVVGKNYKISTDKASFRKNISSDLFRQINSSQNRFYRILDGRHYYKNLKKCIAEEEKKEKTLSYYKMLFFSGFVTAFPQYCFDIFDTKSVKKNGTLQLDVNQFFIRAYGQEHVESQRTGLFIGDLKLCDLDDVAEVELTEPQPSSEIKEWVVRIMACTSKENITLQLVFEDEKALALMNMLQGYITLCHNKRCNFKELTLQSSRIQKSLKSFGPCSRQRAENYLNQHAVKPDLVQSGFLIYQDEEKYNVFNIASRKTMNDVMHQIEWIDDSDKTKSRKFIWKQGSAVPQVFHSSTSLTEELKKKYGLQIACQRGRERLDPSNIFVEDNPYHSVDEQEEEVTNNLGVEYGRMPIPMHTLQPRNVLSDENFLKRALVEDSQGKHYMLVSHSSTSKDTISLQALRTTMYNHFDLARLCRGDTILKFINHVYADEAYLFEMPEYGSLKMYLEHFRSKGKLATYRKMRLAVAVMKVLEDLHTIWQRSSNGPKPILHGNICCQNLYVIMEDQDSIKIKLGDNGLVDYFDVHRTKCEEINDERMPWLAPERRRNLQEKTFESEVYAVGTTLCEILHGATPFRTLLNLLASDKLKDHFCGEDLGEKLKPHELRQDLSDPNCASTEVHDVIKEAWDEILSCWNDEPQDRPASSHLYEIFDNLCGKAAEIRWETEAENVLEFLPASLRAGLTRCSPRDIHTFSHDNHDKYLHPDNLQVEYTPAYRIGGGNFGDVYGGMMKDKQSSAFNKKVAIKKLNDNALTLLRGNHEDFYKEIEISISLKHENIVESFYFSKHGSVPLLILERMNMSLEDYVKNNKSRFHDTSSVGKTRWERTLTTLLLQVSKGMVYLAAKGIAHCDLFARNILLAAKACGLGYVAKVGDFGLAKVFAKEKTYYSQRIFGQCPLYHYPPEYLMNYLEEEGFKIKSSGDVWLFGSLAWEIFSPNDSYKKILDHMEGSPKKDDTKSNVEGIVKLYKTGFRLLKPEHMSNDLYTIVSKCWEHHESDRLVFEEIRRDVENLLSPPKPSNGFIN